MSQMFGSIKENPVVTVPFYCDYGFNISVGENFYTNHNVTIQDGAKVTFGDNVFIYLLLRTAYFQQPVMRLTANREGADWKSLQGDSQNYRRR